MSTLKTDSVSFRAPESAAGSVRRAPVEACVCHTRTGLPQPPHGSEPPRAPRLCSSMGARPAGGGCCCPRVGAGSWVAGLVVALGGGADCGPVPPCATESELYAARPGAAGALGCGWLGAGAALLFPSSPFVPSECCHRSASSCRCSSRASASSLEMFACGCASAAGGDTCCGSPLSDLRVQRTLRPSIEIREIDLADCKSCHSIMQALDHRVPSCARAHPRETSVRPAALYPAALLVVCQPRMPRAQAPAAAAPALPTLRAPS
jgi:hypothetical protein